MSRNIFLDVLKGIAIIAVVLYHWGVSKYGYLGVDIFFVISGYFVTKGLLHSFSSSNFSYWGFLNKRVARLWPGLILISIISLALGWLWMLPLHFKLDCESAVGTCLFGNNFVQYITSGDYWTADNEYKPLMHTWYIGVLMQFYLIIPLIFITAFKFSKQWVNTAFYLLGTLTIASLFLYVSVLMTDAQNFYLLPARFFELGLGGLIGIIEFESISQRSHLKNFLFIAGLIFTVYILFGVDIEFNKLRLIIVVVLTMGLVVASHNFNLPLPYKKLVLPLSFLGLTSYSLYLSHQVFFAFYRYTVNNVFTVWQHFVILLATIALGVFLYYLFEHPLSEYLAKRRKNKYILNSICMIFVISVVSFACYYYKQGGIVRDIPELDLYVGNTNQTPEEYNWRIFAYDKDFKDNGKPNILVIGDSFGRDWINILLESGVGRVMNISYRTEPDDITIRRLEHADYVFVANNGPIFKTYTDILPLLMKKNFYRIGSKAFGTWAGLIYNNDRYGDSYYSQTVQLTPSIRDLNKKEKELFGCRYIDMIHPVKVDDSTMEIFTEDNKMISQDCLHLTKAGAQLYAQRINVWQYLK